MTTPMLGPTNDRLAALFPEPDAPTASSLWQRKRRLAVIAVVTVIAMLVLASRAFGSGGATYRTAVVATHSVDAVLTGVATFEPVAQATVAFPVSGTVGSVLVKVGDNVTAGQALASLDTLSLVEALHTAQKTLAQANLTLKQALSGQTITGGAGGSGQSGPSGISLTSATNGVELAAVSALSSDPTLAALQQSVLQAQQAVDAAIATASSALDAATAVCAAIDPLDSVSLAACQQAIADVLTAQTDVHTAQNTLADASNALDTLLQQRADESSTTPSTGGGGGNGPSGSGGLAPSGGGRSSPSAADLVAYQKSVDAAELEVKVAEQGLHQASIATPLDGTVVAVNLAVDDAVDAASSTANIVVQGPGGYEVSTTVSVERVGDVSVGQHATVIPDGSHRSLSGTVTYVSAVPQSSGGTTTSYLVVVGLDKKDADAHLKNGSTGTVSIVTESAKLALAVPTSAVTTTNSNHTVEIPDGDDTKTVSVKVGVVGAAWTEIKSGLDAGEQVVLADLSKPLPGSVTSSSNTGTGNGFPGAGGFRGGGAFPGGGGGLPGGGG